MMPAVQVRGEVLSMRRAGAYHQLTMVAPGIAEQVRPGHFVALAVGGDDSSMLLRRAFSVYRTQDRGVYGGTVEIVFAEHGKGTRWLAGCDPRRDRRRRAAGQALRAAQGAGHLHAGRWRLRQRAAVHAGRAAARARLPRRLRARCGHRGPAVRCPRGQAHVAVGGDHHRGRLAG